MSVKRRTKLDMKWMKEDVTEYLSRSNNNPHKAFDLFIKEHLERQSLLPHYIKGIKDFINVSATYQAELDKQQAEKEHRQNIKANKEQIVQTLNTMSANDFKPLYMEYKDKVSNSDKLNLVTIYTMIHQQDFRGFDETLLNTILNNNINLTNVEATA